MMHAGPLALTGGCAASVSAARCDAAMAEDAAAAVGAPARAAGWPIMVGMLGSGGVLADAVLGRQTAGAPPLHPRLAAVPHAVIGKNLDFRAHAHSAV